MMLIMDSTKSGFAEIAMTGSMELVDQLSPRIPFLFTPGQYSVRETHMVEIIRGETEFAQGKIKIGIEKWRGTVLLSQL